MLGVGDRAVLSTITDWPSAPRWRAGRADHQRGAGHPQPRVGGRPLLPPGTAGLDRLLPRPDRLAEHRRGFAVQASTWWCSSPRPGRTSPPRTSQLTLASRRSAWLRPARTPGSAGPWPGRGVVGGGQQLVEIAAGGAERGDADRDRDPERGPRRRAWLTVPSLPCHRCRAIVAGASLTGVTIREIFSRSRSVIWPGFRGVGAGSRMQNSSPPNRPVRSPSRSSASGRWRWPQHRVPARWPNVSLTFLK